jgi:hypothetical protein
LFPTPLKESSMLSLRLIVLPTLVVAASFCAGWSWGVAF